MPETCADLKRWRDLGVSRSESENLFLPPPGHLAPTPPSHFLSQSLLDGFRSFRRSEGQQRRSAVQDRIGQEPKPGIIWRWKRLVYQLRNTN
ncbi:hypothetical protein J6590_046810 [Homalodisca vitripennis]|nr:hypothetical protein J6590_046810 [Homalodisca vitripennis]